MDKQLVDGEQPVVVGVLVVCVCFRERIERHRGDVRRQGVGRPCVPSEGRTGENVGDGVCVEPREVVAEREPAVRAEFDLERDRLLRVAVEKSVLPCDNERVLRRYAVPQLARASGLGKQVPVRLRDDAERSHERREPVVRGDYAIGAPDKRIDFAEGINAQTADFVRADLKHPVRQGDVHPVSGRSESPPVLADGRAWGRGEVKLLVRADACHDESAPEVVSGQHVRGIRRDDGREARPLVRDGRRIADKAAVGRMKPALESLLLVVRDGSGRDERLQAAAGADHHLDVVGATVAATAVAATVSAAGLGAGYHPHGDEERAEQHTPDLRLPLEDVHKVLHGTDVLLVHERDEPRNCGGAQKRNKQCSPEPQHPVVI